MHLLTLVAAVAVAVAVCGVAQAQTPVFGHRTYNGKYTYSHADLNNDGREDLVFFTQTGFGVVLSTSDATYGTETDYTVPDSASAGTVTLDLNSDGKLDIIAFNAFASGFYEYLNNGDGTFHLEATVAMSNIYDMVVGDFNHDGYPDIAFTTPGALHVWFNNHAGGFTVGPTTSVPVITELSVGDFDGDGKADVIASNNTGTYVYFGDNTGHFPAIVNASTAHYPIVIGMDIDGDGKTDLVGAAVASSNQGVDTFYRELFVIYGNASRTIAESSIPLNGYAVSWLYSNPAKSPSADVADFNGDGKQDFAMVESQNSDGSGTRSLVVLTGKGGRLWNPELTVYSNSELDFGVAAIRANRDNRPDLLVDTFANNSTTAQFFVNDTSGGFYGGCPAPNAAEVIHLCSSTTSSSTTVTFKASAAGQTIMRKMEIWVDGVKNYEQIASHDFSHYAFLQKALTLSTGSHKVTIYAAGYDNLLEKNTYTVTVQ
jgi:hypothetical protein